MTIKVLEKVDGCMPSIIDKGDWIDLYVAEDTKLPYRGVTYVSLGVAMQLPDGCEAVMVARSSTPKKKRVLQANGQAVIDNSFSGNDDEWKFPAYPISKGVELHKGDRICQFRIQLSQKATFWQKIKWLFSSSIKLQKVSCLCNKSRSGLGSTGN